MANANKTIFHSICLVHAETSSRIMNPPPT